MFSSNSSLDDVLSSILPSKTKIKERTSKNKNEAVLRIQIGSEMKIKKIFNVSEIKEKRILKFIEVQSLLSECSLPFIYPFQILQMNNMMIYERSYYSCDLKSIIYTKCLSLSEISSIMIRLSEILIILSECDMNVSNLKSSNIIYENNEVKLCDLCLNELRKEEEMRIDDVCYMTVRELLCLESDIREIYSWKLGCYLYEMLNKKLPFNENDDMNKTLNNILKGILNNDIKVDDEMMKDMLYRMLKVENEDRLSLMEFKKEMIKENEILRDSENNIMIIEERKEILFNNDYSIIKLPIIYTNEYYMKSEKLEEIRDDLIEKYNKKPDERILSILLTTKLYKRDYSIKNKLKFQNYHECKESRKYIDKVIFNIDTDYNDKELIKIDLEYLCLCEEGVSYFFRIMRQINPKKLDFSDVTIPIQSQQLFGLCFSHLSNLQELNISKCNLTFHFIQSFVKSIPSTKLCNINIESNPIKSTGFRLLLPYLHLLFNNRSTIYLNKMDLDDGSMILLSFIFLHRFPNFKKIDIRENSNIHSIGLYTIFSEFPISQIQFDFNGSKELLINKGIPELVKYITYKNELELNDLNVDDVYFISFFTLRLKELREIEILDLRNNKLTSESIEILINNLLSLPNLKELELYGNPIGDVGMKILSQHLNLLINYYNNEINCSKMELSSDGLKYLLDGMKNIHEKIDFDISENNIDSSGIEYLMNYMKENDNIEKIFIHGNMIGNDGFKLLENVFKKIKYDNEIILSDISIDDESVILLTNKIDSIGKCKTINLFGNNIKMKGLKSICEKSLENENYPFIEMKSSNWRNEEVEYYLNYCIKKERRDIYRKVYDFSNMNLNDSHISLIKKIDYQKMDLSNNKISCKGLKELTDSLPKDSRYISIFGNKIGDEGVEIICRCLFDFIQYSSLLNLSNIGMGEKGLRMLIERLKDYKPLDKIDISRNELNEEGLRLFKENQILFYKIDELSIIVKENINKNELKSFLETFSGIAMIKIYGINEEEKKGLKKHFFNIKL